MSKDYVGSLVRALVGLDNDRLALVQDLANKLQSEQGERSLDTWLDQLRLFLRQEPCFVTMEHDGRFVSMRLRHGRMKFIDGAVIPAGVKKFVVDPKLLIRISDNFTRWFLNVIEEPQPEIKLVYHELIDFVKGTQLVNMLGGEWSIESSLASVFHLLRIQGTAQDGILKTEWPNNIFFVRGVDGILRIVRVFRGDMEDGWSVDVADIEDPWSWPAGTRVFSPSRIGN